MQFRQTALPHDIQYCMDCAVESFEISAFDYAVVSLFGEIERVDRIWNGARPPSGARGWRGGRMVVCLDIDAYAHEIAQTLSIAEQRSLFAFNLTAEPRHILSTASCLSEWNFTDETIGGDLKPFRNARRRVDRSFNPTKALARHLLSPKAILRYVKMDDQTIPHYRSLNANLRRLPWPLSVSEGEEIIAWMTAQTDDIRHRQVIAEQKFSDRLRKEHEVKKPKIQKKARRSIIRSAGLASTVVGPEQTSAFVRGELVEIRGDEVTFAVARRQSLSKNGHGAISVDLNSLEGKRLASLCVYFDGMPALDQLAAIKMHVDSGDEKSILSNGNLFSITENGMNHPVVLAHKKEVVPAMAVMGEWEIAGRNEHQLMRDAVARYQDATKGHYIGAVMQQVWGRDAKRVSEILRAAQK